jgi:hypothetical protein
MSTYASPALHQPELHLSAAAMRGLLAVVAFVITAGLWFAVAAQAGQYGERDAALRVELEPVVISGHRLLPDAATMAMGAAPAAECSNLSAVR